MRSILLALCLLPVAASLRAQDSAPDSEPVGYKVYGSIGSETMLSPQNGKSLLNPGGVLNVPLWTNTADVILFGDFSAPDKRWTLHFKLRGQDEWQGHNGYGAQVGELYLNWSAASWLDFSIGRKIEKWGTGYGWNPTGVINPLKDPRDPNDRNDSYRGVDQASVDLFVKGWNLTGMVVPVIPWTGTPANRPVPVGWAAKAYRLLHGTDLSFTASGGSGLPDSQGVNVARVFGRALELHAEAAVFHNTLRLVPGAEGFEYSKKSHAETLVGGQYTFPNYLNLTLEYYHNGANLSASQWNQYRLYAGQAGSDLAQGNPAALAQVAAQFSALSMARDYTFLRAAWPLKRQKLDAETIVITSLRDGSSVIQPGLYWKVTPVLTAYCLETEFAGKRRSEIGFVPIRRETIFGFRFHF